VEDKITSDIVNREVLIEAGLLSGINKRLPIKILNGETFTKKLIFEGIDKFSATAQSKIAETGSTIK
jgi:large subunit ribosomal protein L15